MGVLYFLLLTVSLCAEIHIYGLYDYEEFIPRMAYKLIWRQFSIKVGLSNWFCIKISSTWDALFWTCDKENLILVLKILTSFPLHLFSALT